MKKFPKTAQPKPAKRKFVKPKRALSKAAKLKASRTAAAIRIHKRIAEREILIKHLAPRIVAFLAEIKREKEAKERQSIPRLET